VIWRQIKIGSKAEITEVACVFVERLRRSVKYEDDRPPTEWSVSNANPDHSVRPDGAEHQWRKIPPGELSVRSGS